MELKLLCEKTLKIFGIGNINELSDSLKECCLNNDVIKLKSFKELQDDLSDDLLQKIYQYYEADRIEKKQDYTPKTLAKLVARLSGGETVVDMCAGSGALTIQSWNIDKKAKHICLELDENVIPFLMFNMMLRNMDGIIVVADAIKNEYKSAFKLEPGEEFSKLSEIENDIEVKGSCISNPPYNLRWEHGPLINFDTRFVEHGIPPESNANYVFLLSAIEKCDKGAFILPNGVLTTDNKQEKEVIKSLVDSKMIKAIITCPERMFEATSIPTCIILYDKANDGVAEMIDLRDKGTKEIREQNGQFGGASHTGRTYKKEINVISDELIDKVINAIDNHEDVQGFCKPATVEDIAKQGYRLTPSMYVEPEPMEDTTRSYVDIVTDLNRVIVEKNKCKLTINETLAKGLGFDLEVFKSSSNTEYDKLIEKLAGQKIVKDDYFRTTKNKNEVKFENGSKEEVSSIFMMIFNMWKQHIYYLNNEENRYLVELRDKLLPDLMSGKIEVGE